MHDEICDIETGLSPDVVDQITKLYPFNPDDVSIDPRWKEDTVDRKIEEARNNHLPKMLDKAQLDPALSFVCSFGLLGMEDAEPTIRICMSPTEEKDGLKWIFSKMNDQTEIVRFIGFFFEDFDMEFMWKRAWIHGLKPPAVMRRGRYWNSDRVIDLSDIWTFNNSKNPWPSLDKVVRILGVKWPHRPHGVTGKDFWNLIRSSDPTENLIGMNYAKADLFEERSIAQRIM